MYTLHRHKRPKHLCIGYRGYLRIRAIVDINARSIAVKPVVKQLGGGLDGASRGKQVNRVRASARGCSGKDGLSGEGQAGAVSGRRRIQRHFMINQQIIFLCCFLGYHKILATTATFPAILATLPAICPILRIGWMILLNENLFSSGAESDAKLNEVMETVGDGVSKQVMIYYNIIVLYRIYSVFH